MKTVLIDAGNTRRKWAVARQGRIEHCGVWDADAEFAPVDMHRGASQLLALNVGSGEVTARIHHYALTLGCPLRWIVSLAEAAGVKNGYVSPGTLGADRFAGLVAVRSQTRQPALVVSAGTALTVDMLAASGVFLGGVIVPGRALMQQALRAGLPGLDQAAGTLQDAPRTTRDAWVSGIARALAGAVELQYRVLQSRVDAPLRVFLTGGDAAWLSPALALAHERIDDLVFRGMLLLGEEKTA
jgi:type III pantothenate kinase